MNGVASVTDIDGLELWFEFDYSFTHTTQHK